MLMIAKDLKQSILIDSLSHICNVLIHEKLLSHLDDVTSKVHPICNNLNKFGNLVTTHTFIDVTKVAGRLFAGLEDHNRYHNSITKSSTSLFGKSSL